MKHHPLVSVIMPVFNAERYVEAAIESILNQSYEIANPVIGYLLYK